MSGEVENHDLRRDYDALADQQAVETAFRAHTSPAFSRLAHRAAGIDPSGTSPSLATCEKVPTSDWERVQNHPEEYELAEHITDAREAVEASVSRSRDRQRKVLALIEEGEVAHAKRLALCGRKSVQLECPQMAGGCGSDGNYVPVHCDSRLCPDCAKRRQGRLMEKYRGTVQRWDHPAMLRLSLPRRVEPRNQEHAVEELREAFGNLRRRVIPAEGEHQGKRWVWKSDGGEPADHYWKQALLQAGERELAKYLEMKYVSQGRGIPFEEIVPTGFYGIDIKQGEDGTLNVHVHVLADVAHVPQAALSAVWDDVVGAPVVDVRRVEERGEMGTESAVAEVVGYAAKPPEFESVDDEAAYLTALKGSKLIQPFGELHGNTPDVVGLLRCCDCEEAPRYWNYVGVVDEQVSTAMVGGADGDRPPPE
jgi:hypothetical protein